MPNNFTNNKLCTTEMAALEYMGLRVEINFRENQRYNQEWTIQRQWRFRLPSEKKGNNVRNGFLATLGLQRPLLAKSCSIEAAA